MDEWELMDEWEPPRRPAQQAWSWDPPPIDPEFEIPPIEHVETDPTLGPNLGRPWIFRGL